MLGELKNLSIDVAAVQETHFTCGADSRVLESDFNVFSAYGSRTSVGVSLIVGRSLDADVDVVFAGDGGRTGCGRCLPLKVSSSVWLRFILPISFWFGGTDYKLVRVSLLFVKRPSLASYWKFNTSLLEIWYFRVRLENLIQRALVGAVIGNKWWASLKYRIRDFAIKYRQQLALNRAKKVKLLRR